MSRIRTYEDLLQEEQRLKEQLSRQETMIRQDIAGMRENFEPVKKIYDTVHKIFTRDNRVPFFNVGLELAIDILLRRLILVRAGWFAKTFVPYIVKNYSSHIIGEEKRKAIVKKIRDLFNKIRPKAPDPKAGAAI
jgi:hypothetical protein